MKKIFIFIALLWASVSAVHAQQDTTTFFGKSNYMFQHLDKNQISSGLMSDYGVEFMDLANNDGVSLNSANFVGLQEWRLLYASLYSAQINGTAHLEYLDAINSRVLNYISLSQPITLAVMHYNYQSMRSDAVSANLVSVANDQMYDVAGRSQSPYQNRQVFAVAPLRQTAVLGNNPMIFRPDMFFSNTGKTVSSIGIDAGESGNYQTVGFNTPFSLNFTQAGFVSIAVRITYTDSSVAYAHTKLLITPLPEGSGDNLINAKGGQVGTQRFGSGNGSFPVRESVTASKNYLGNLASGDITVQLSVNNGTGQIRKPLIVVEGFDIDNSFDFNSFARSIGVDDNQTPPGYVSLNYGLDEISGYDLIFLNFANATDYIQRNAYLLEKVIEIVNARKINLNGVRQANVVMGLSMGGLVARYALRDLEVNNISHETRLFITHDTPHHGANVPVGFQAAVQHLAPFKMVNADLGGGFPYIRDIRWDDMFPDIITAKAAFNTAAAKQMLIQRYQLNTTSYNLSADNSMSQAFFNELDNMGWPQNSKNLTVSNGSCSGTTIFPANSRIFEIIGDRPMSYGGNLWRSALMSIAAPVSPIAIYGGNVNPLSLLVQFPLSLISTKSSVNLDFRVNSVPEGGTGELYRGDLFVKRKLLWIVNSNSFILKTRINSTPEMLPLDNAPGGTYDMLHFGIDPNIITNSLPPFFQGINAVVKQPKFCFVPTVSSLAITNPWQNLKNNLCQSINCLSASGVNNYYAPQQNQLHISFAQPTADWILKWQDPAFSCSKICLANLSISGADQICESGAYSIANLPAGAVVKWKVLDGWAGSISDVNSPQMILSRDDYGFVLLGAEISGGMAGCDVTELQPVRILVGNPFMVSIAETSSNGLGGGSDLCNHAYDYDDYANTFTVTLNQLPSDLNLNLQVNVEYQMWGPDGLVLQGTMANFTQNPFRAFSLPAYMDPGFYNLDLRVSGISGCDTPSEWYETGFYYKNCGFAKALENMKVYPNPAADRLIVSLPEGSIDTRENSPQENKMAPGQSVVFQKSAKTDAKNSKLKNTLILYDDKMKVVAQQVVTGKDTALDTSLVPNGTYYLHFTLEGTVEKRQIIIKH
jgi:hypothetical protein